MERRKKEREKRASLKNWGRKEWMERVIRSINKGKMGHTETYRSKIEVNDKEMKRK